LETCLNDLNVVEYLWLFLCTCFMPTCTWFMPTCTQMCLTCCFKCCLDGVRMRLNVFGCFEVFKYVQTCLNVFGFCWMFWMNYISWMCLLCLRVFNVCTCDWTFYVFWMRLIFLDVSKCLAWFWMFLMVVNAFECVWMCLNVWKSSRIDCFKCLWTCVLFSHVFNCFWTILNVLNGLKCLLNVFECVWMRLNVFHMLPHACDCCQ
jgi:hypothetical protein